MNKISLIIYTGLFHLVHLTVRIKTIFFVLIGLKYWFPKRNKTVIFFENFPVENAGYHYRAKKWAEILNEEGFKAKVVTTIPSKQKFEVLLKDKTTYFFSLSLLIRTYQIFMSIGHQTVIVRRELLHYNDYGNLFLEKLLFALHKNVILDFDDDISASKQEPRTLTSIYSKLMLENNAKFISTLEYYKRFIVGSQYLKELVIKHNNKIDKEDVAVIPTCVDYEGYPIKKYPDNIPDPIVFGWIGGTGNLEQLRTVLPALNEIHKNTPIKLLIISGAKFIADVDFEIENIIWRHETQINDMLRIDIGLMPLTLTPITKGKCGFKLIQYMGLGIVSVASGITVNKEIITDSYNGFLISAEKNDWQFVFEKAIGQFNNFESIGMNARERIKQEYSFKSKTTKYINFVSECF